MDVPTWAIAPAAIPAVALAAMVLRAWPLPRASWCSAALAAGLATTAFGLSIGEASLGVLRGAWTGAWILGIVLPALLLFEVLDRSGALELLADAAAALAPTEGRQLLLLAWVLPSFLQGAAGFGVPIAMSAPMLVRRGFAPTAAVAACLIGYQWSVTFGSMGSSYFVAAATARLGDGDAASFALRAGVVLAISAVASGLLVLGRGRRSPGDVTRALAIGAVMAVVLVAVVRVQPALGSTAAGLAGLVACWRWLPRRGSRRAVGAEVRLALLPYLALTVSTAVAFGVPAVRLGLEAAAPSVAPVLPGVDAAFGFSKAASALTPTLRPLLHPLPYLLLAIATAAVTARRQGWLAAGCVREITRSWSRRSYRTASSILGLTVLAAVMTEAGMIAALAAAIADLLGVGFVAVSAPLGALGTVLTGSTTTSNALLSSLQSEVAVMLAIAPAALLVGQTAGGNIGNALAPAVATVGTAATGTSGREGEVLRRNVRDAAVLLGLVVLLTAAQVWMLA